MAPLATSASLAPSCRSLLAPFSSSTLPPSRFCCPPLLFSRSPPRLCTVAMTDPSPATTSLSGHLSESIKHAEEFCAGSPASGGYEVEVQASQEKDQLSVLGIWQSAEAVCFDVDSTVCMDEGIDELGDFCGAGEAVAAWTSSAMGGSIPFEEALAARLSLFKPSLNDVEKFLATHPPKITPGIEELVKKLKSRGTSVYLVSGGFRQMIAPVASILHIPEERIFANRLLFDKSGHYMGFDIEEPTSRSGGKAAVIAQIKQKFGYKKLVMVGDGATDLEARRPGGADIFVCFGGVQLRASVAAQSDWCVQRFKDLIESLDHPHMLVKL